MGGITHQLVIAGFLPWTVRYRMIRYVSAGLPFGFLLQDFFFPGGSQVHDRQVIVFICGTVVLHIWVTSKYTAYWKSRVLMYLRLVDYNCDLWRDVNFAEIGGSFFGNTSQILAGNELRLGFGSVFVHSSGAQVSFGQCARRRNSTCTQRMRPFARILNDNQAERGFFVAHPSVFF